MLKSHYTYAYSHICFFPTFTCSAFYFMGSHLRLFLLIEWLMTCMSWTGFISWLGYCSKCWHCCLSKLVTYHCMFLRFGIFLSSFQALMFEQGHRETFYFGASSIYFTFFAWMGICQELINEMGVPAVFSDYCEEACHLAECCITRVTGRPLAIPVCIHIASSSF